MWNRVLNLLFIRTWRAQRGAEEFIEAVRSEGAETFLKLLLNLMKLFFFINEKFHRNIENFNGRYLFCSRDMSITVAAVFKNGKLKVSEKVIPNTHMTVTFKNAKALMGFLLSPKPDILGAMLRQEVTVNGNLNYLYKFAFMAKQLQIMASETLQK